MKKYILTFIIGSMGLGSANAQKAWGLRECCDYAVENNIGVKQQQNQCRQQEIQLSTAKNSRLPDLSASLNQNFSFGRGLTMDKLGEGKERYPYGSGKGLCADTL